MVPIDIKEQHKIIIITEIYVEQFKMPFLLLQKERKHYDLPLSELPASTKLDTLTKLPSSTGIGPSYNNRYILH